MRIDARLRIEDVAVQPALAVAVPAVSARLLWSRIVWARPDETLKNNPLWGYLPGVLINRESPQTLNTKP